MHHLRRLAQDYWVTFNNLKNTPQGDVLSLNKIAGPTICCSWVSTQIDLSEHRAVELWLMCDGQNLDAVLTSGWYDDFKDQLKYITLQHYPQDKCVLGFLLICTY